MFFFFRCTTFIGVCVEFVAAITWLAELFPIKRQKEIALGSTQPRIAGRIVRDRQ